MITYITDLMGINVATNVRQWLFPGGEVGIDINDLSALDGLKATRVYVDARIRNSDDVMALVMTTNALRHEFPLAKFMLDMPYVPYARQDRVCNRGEACEGSHCMGMDEYETFVYIKSEGKYYTLKTQFEYNRHDKQYYYIDNWSKGAGETFAEEMEPTAEMKGSIQILWETFGGTVNEAGFKELDSHIGLIYGDSITLDRANHITRKLEKMGFASTNVVFGIGSYTYQCNTRDTFGTAMKATGTGVEGDFFEIYKDPATGDKLKQSARGLLRVDLVDGEYVLTDKVTAEQEAGGELKLRFQNGAFFNLTNIAEVRERLA